MRYPPSLSFRPQVSWVQRGMVIVLGLLLLITMIFIALGSINSPGTRSIDGTRAIWLGCAALCLIWLAKSQWQPEPGRLTFSQGHWFWQSDGSAHAISGTLQPHLDLQTYILARFVPDDSSLGEKGKQISFAHGKQRWLHLEQRHFMGDDSLVHQPLDQPGQLASWLDLRRALLFSQHTQWFAATSQESTLHEKPAL